jgi:hypothetical protein
MASVQKLLARLRSHGFARPAVAVEILRLAKDESLLDVVGFSQRSLGSAKMLLMRGRLSRTDNNVGRT